LSALKDFDGVIGVKFFSQQHLQMYSTIVGANWSVYVSKSLNFGWD